MEDFIRLNLNSMIGILFYLVIIFSVFFILKKTVPSEHQKFVGWFLTTALIIGVIIIFFTLLSQASTNQLPKSKIDRSYTTQTQSEYERRVKNNSKEDK